MGQDDNLISPSTKPVGVYVRGGTINSSFGTVEVSGTIGISTSQISVLGTVANQDIPQFKVAMRYDANGNMEYQGWTTTGMNKGSPGWLIVKNTYDANGNKTDMEFGGTLATFSQIWNDAGSLNYG